MLNINAKLFAINLGIVGLYFILTCFEFVMTRSPNPIGIGTQQLGLVVLHSILVIIYGLTSQVSYEGTAGLIMERFKRIIVGLFAIVLCAGFFTIFGDRIWTWLWKLRGQ